MKNNRPHHRVAAALATFLIAGAASLCALPSSAAPAAQEDPSTLILSDTLNYDDIKKESSFTGNVVLTRGDMTLHADALTMRQLPDGTQQGTATAGKSKMVRIRQERPATFEAVEGTGLRAEYDDKKGEFDLIGQAVVIRYVCGKPLDTIRGERVRYNEKAGTYQAQGGPNSSAAGGRVRSVAEPRSKSDAAQAQCRAQQSSGKAK